MKKFCERCGQSLKEGFDAWLNKAPSYEFDDGWYCEGCAKLRVEEKRKKQNIKGGK